MNLPPELISVIPAESVGAYIHAPRAGSERKSDSRLQLRRWSSVGYEPFDYQKSLSNAIAQRAKAGNPIRGILSLPTGSGKTSTCSLSVLQSLESMQTGLVWWIAPQRELLSQAMSSFSKVWHAGFGPDSLDLQILPNSREGVQPTGRASVLFGTPDTFLKLHEKNVSKSVTHLVFDEAHHLPAPTYAKVWTKIVDESPSLIMALGLTATPSRTRNSSIQTLKNLCGETLFLSEKLLPDPVQSLQKMGVLSAIDLSLIPGLPTYLSSNLLPPSAVSESGVFWSRIFDLVVKNKDRKTLVYMPSVQLGRLLTDHLVHSGVPAQFISGDDALGIRIEKFENFRDGTHPVLVNVGLLLEGVDVPDAEVVVIPYSPTQISLIQMIGRVSRGPLVGGSDCSQAYFGSEVTLSSARTMQSTYASMLASWPDKVLL